MLRKFVLFLMGASAVTVLSPAGLPAAIIPYDNQTSFLSDAAALGYTASMIDFDGVSGGPVAIASGGSVSGVTFTYDFGTVSLTITNGFDTTSPSNFLGTDDGNVLLDGDEITFSFSPRTGFGLYIISADALFDGDFVLATGPDTATLLSAGQTGTLQDGSGFWFLGLLSDSSSTFSSVTLKTPGGVGAFFYNLDDLVLTTVSPPPGSAVPEPSSIALAMLASAGVGIRCRRRPGNRAASSTEP